MKNHNFNAKLLWWHKLNDNIEFELQKLCNWFYVNKLTLNVAKTAYVIYGDADISFNIEMNKTPLVQSTSVKFLGIFIDNKLKWNKHIEYLENKLNFKYY
jgi:hypothetical protein